MTLNPQALKFCTFVKYSYGGLMRYMGDIIEKSTDALRDWFFDHIQGYYPTDNTPTFDEWLDGLTNTELLHYLSIGEEIYYERSCETQS